MDIFLLSGSIRDGGGIVHMFENREISFLLLILYPFREYLYLNVFETSASILVDLGILFQGNFDSTRYEIPSYIFDISRCKYHLYIY